MWFYMFFYRICGCGRNFRMTHFFEFDVFPDFERSTGIQRSTAPALHKHRAYVAQAQPQAQRGQRGKEAEGPLCTVGFPPKCPLIINQWPRPGPYPRPWPWALGTLTRSALESAGGYEVSHLSVAILAQVNGGTPAQSGRVAVLGAISSTQT